MVFCGRAMGDGTRQREEQNEHCWVPADERQTIGQAEWPGGVLGCEQAVPIVHMHVITGSGVINVRHMCECAVLQWHGWVGPRGHCHKRICTGSCLCPAPPPVPSQKAQVLVPLYSHMGPHGASIAHGHTVAQHWVHSGTNNNPFWEEPAQCNTEGLEEEWGSEGPVTEDSGRHSASNFAPHSDAASAGHWNRGAKGHGLQPSISDCTAMRCVFRSTSTRSALLWAHIDCVCVPLRPVACSQSSLFGGTATSGPVLCRDLLPHMKRASERLADPKLSVKHFCEVTIGKFLQGHAIRGLNLRNLPETRSCSSNCK